VDERSGTAFAKKVFPNGLAEKAGFQTGDVISAINGKKPQTRTEAIDMLSRLPIGEEAVFTIQRADKTRELRVVAE
jgi:regulator of sigma E protease